MGGFTTINFTIRAWASPPNSVCCSAPNNGISPLSSVLVVGLHAAGSGHHPLHPAPSGYVLAVDHPDRGLAGRLVYIVSEMAPDAGLLKQSFKVFPRRRRIRELEAAVIDNPSAGNYEELGRPLP